MTSAEAVDVPIARTHACIYLHGVFPSFRVSHSILFLFVLHDSRSKDYNTYGFIIFYRVGQTSRTLYNIITITILPYHALATAPRRLRLSAAAYYINPTTQRAGIIYGGDAVFFPSLSFGLQDQPLRRDVVFYYNISSVNIRQFVMSF